MFTLGLGLPTDPEVILASQFWRLMLLVPIVIAVFQTLVILRYFNRDTPVFLLLEKKDE